MGGEAAGNKILVEQALESRVARGTKGKNPNKKRACRKNPKSKKCKDNRKNGKQGRKIKKKKGNKNEKRKNGQSKGKRSKKGGNNTNKKNKSKAKRKPSKEKKKIAKELKRKEKKRARKQKMRNTQDNEKNNKGKVGRMEKPRASSRATVNLTCLTTAIQLLKFQKDNVNNFLARHTRQTKQNALTTKKQGKKGEFAEPAARLIQAGGGNKSNLSCGGSTESAGAKQLLNLTNMLSECPTLIKAACA